MTRIVVVAMLVFFVSPLWPIGDNPTVGDPFVIVNIQTNKLAYVAEGEIKGIYPVATGKLGQETPLGKFTITVKAVNPYYRRTNIEGGAPENPLGSRWIGFDANGTDGRTYGLHGTNRPEQIGYSVTAGCIRLPNGVVEDLYDKMPLGTKC